MRTSSSTLIQIVWCWALLWAAVASVWEWTWPVLPFGPLWATLGPFICPFFPGVCSLICVFSGMLSECSGLVKRRPSWEERRAPQTSWSWTSVHQHWEEAAFPGFHETQRNCRDLREHTEKEGKENYRSRGKRYLGQKITFLFMTLYRRAITCTYSNPEIIEMHSVRPSRGKGVGLQTLCAREEEWVPGDVILTGREQLSQYNRLQEKRSHRKTENTKPSPAIFSLIWHREHKSMTLFSSPVLFISSLSRPFIDKVDWCWR